jgi:hypothetical protein
MQETVPIAAGDGDTVPIVVGDAGNDARVANYWSNRSDSATKDSW